MGHVLVALVDVSLQPSQHCTPRAITQKFGQWAHQQYHIVHCPHEVFEVVDVRHVQ